MPLFELLRKYFEAWAEFALMPGLVSGSDSENDNKKNDNDSDSDKEWRTEVVSGCDT